MKKLLLSLFLIPSIGLTEVKVENFTFERTESTDKTYIIVSTERTTNVKCAIYDKNDKPVRVSDGIVTPPMGELEVLSRNSMITSVECWEKPVLQNLDEFGDMYLEELIALLQESADYDEFQAEFNRMLIEVGISIQNLSSYDERNYARILDVAKNYHEVSKLADEERIRLDELEAERTAQKLAYENEQYNRLLTLEAQAELDAQKLQISDQQNTLKEAYVNNISARIKSFWRYQGAEDDWTCEVYVVQDRDGTVVAVDVRNCNVDNSNKAKVFKDSIRRAVYKASPLPSAPDEAVFDKELVMKFSVN